MKAKFKRTAWAVVLMGACCAQAQGQGQAQVAAPAAGMAQEVQELQLFVGETRVLPAPHAGRLAVGNGQALSAAVLDDKEILLIANNPGVSSLHVWTTDGKSRRYKITVMPGETARVTREIAEFLAGMPGVRVKSIGDKVAVEGDDLGEEDRKKIAQLAKAYPQIINFTGQMGWEKMIHMDVKVVEVGRNGLRDLGIKWSTEAQGPTLAVAGDLKHNRYFTVVGDLKNEDGLRAAYPYIPPFKSHFGIVTELTSRLRLLEQNGEAVVLAEPQLTTRSGSKAEFQSGGEIPYSVVSALGQVTVVFKKYGILLYVEPTADAHGAIRSQIKAEVSEPDISLVANGVPGLRTRRTETEFNVRDGETMVLSGIIDRRTGEAVDKVPGLGSIPVLGHLFRSKRFTQNESELLVFVTPRVVTAGDRTLGQRREALRQRADGALKTQEPEPALVHEAP